MTRIAVLVGTPQPASRTRLVAEEVAAQLCARSGADIDATIDLADVAETLFRFPEPRLDELRERIASADVAVIASPTYKAAYTGLLKAFLDRYGSDGLRGLVAVPLLTIGAPTHALAVETTLRPLLVELGASVPTRGLAFPAAAVEERSQVVADWLEAEWPRIRHAFAGGTQPGR